MVGALRCDRTHDLIVAISNSNLKVDEEDVNKLLETDPVPVEQPSSEERTDLEDVFRWEEEYVLHAPCGQEREEVVTIFPSSCPT